MASLMNIEWAIYDQNDMGVFKVEGHPGSSLEMGYVTIWWLRSG